MKAAPEILAVLNDPNTSEAVKKKLREQLEVQKCLAKQRYMTEEAAEIRSHYFNNESRGTSKKKTKTHVYKCRTCGFFHLTTQERRR